MTDGRNLPTQDSAAGQPKALRNEARRRMLRGGLGTTPLLLTLVSRPVLGQVTCFSPSGFVSMPTSVHGTPQTCIGRTPGYWKQTQHFNDWLAPYYPTTTTGSGGHTATTFNSVFGSTASPYTNETFLLVLSPELYPAGWSTSGPPHDVARHCVAALLNWRKGWVTVLTKAQILNIWKSYITLGYFEPTAGVRWNNAQIVGYLTSTMI